MAVAPALLFAVSVVGCGGGDAAGPPFSKETPKPAGQAVGLQDSFVDLADPTALPRIGAMADLGASVVRVNLVWHAIAPTRPADPRNPDDPAYNWQGYDRVVAEAARQRVKVLFSVWGTPAWAADQAVLGSLPERIPASAARPADPADFGAFAEAAARHYGPRGVRLWEAWNEPNAAIFLYPQFERRSGRRPEPVSPVTYAGLLRAFYDGIKAASPDATVGGAVTAPAGDGPRARNPQRVRPADFLRILDEPELRPPMDVVSHHPYPITRPREITPPGRDYIDLYNVGALIDIVDSTYLRGKDVWLTEYGFATAPVDEYSLSFTPEEQALNIVDAYQRLRAEPRVTLHVYYFFQDHERWRSGLRDLDGTPKPGEAAFALPFAVERDGPAPAKGGTRLVGQVRPSRGQTTVTVQVRSGSSWRRLTNLRTAGDGSFALVVRPQKEVAVLRARWTGTVADGARVTRESVEVTVAPTPPA